MVHIVELLSTCSLACKLASSEPQRDGDALLPDVRRVTQKLLDDRLTSTELCFRTPDS
jgi:hypothetical protein